MARRGIADFIPKDLVTRERQNAYWNEVLETSSKPHRFHALNDPLAALKMVTRPSQMVYSKNRSPTPVEDVRKLPPYADYRSPIGSFYRPLVDEKSRIFQGAAGKSRTLVGYSSASAFHVYMHEKNPTGQTIRGEDSVPASARSDILRNTSRCM